MGRIDPSGKSSKALVSIFNQSLIDFSTISKLSFSERNQEWLNYEVGLYDLTYHDGTKDTLFTRREKKHNTVLADKENNPTINVGGKYYELGQVSNILVGFSAYYAGYNETTLNIGSTLFNAFGGGNGLYEDNFDKFLYHVGYEYAQGLREEGNKSITMGQIQGVIALGITYREQAKNNPNVFDYFNQMLDSFISKTR